MAIRRPRLHQAHHERESEEPAERTEEVKLNEIDRALRFFPPIRRGDSSRLVLSLFQVEKKWWEPDQLSRNRGAGLLLELWTVEGDQPGVQVRNSRVWNPSLWGRSVGGEEKRGVMHSA